MESGHKKTVWETKSQLRIVSSKKRQLILQQLTKIATKKRNKIAPVSHFTQHQKIDMEEFCKRSPSTNMPRFLEKAILKRINAQGLEKQYPDLIKTLLSETKRDFSAVTLQSGIENKLKKEKKSFRIEPYKFLGRTENYGVFLASRAELRTKFVLHQSLIRRILKECVTKLPRELFDMKTVLNQELEVEELRRKLLETATAAGQILEEFYQKIVQFTEKDKLNVASLTGYLEACTGVLSVIMSQTIASTLLNVATFIKCNLFPYLKLNVTFNKTLSLQPTADEIVAVFNEFTGRIVNSAKHFNSLEKYKVKSLPEKKMFLCLTDDFLESISFGITKSITSHYGPILEFLNNIQQDFLEIYQDLRDEGATIQKSDLHFENACKSILYYRAFVPKVMFIPSCLYFDIGKIVLNDYRDSIKDILLRIIEDIFQGLSSQHEWEVDDICETFQLIATRARQKPITTEELVEIGKYMAWVKNEYLEELSERVDGIVEKLAKLIMLGSLKPSHIVSNAKAINWLEEIAPILEENSAEFEQLKFEAEEKLQKAVEDINIYIKEIYPLLHILDSMDNVAKSSEYLKSITLHMVKMKDLETKINWINSEEVALNFPKTVYAEYEELKNYIFPFYHLLKLCLDVQRKLFVWLDGPFDLIDFEKTQKRVKRFQSELLGIQKTYRAKIRQAQDDNLPLRFKGVMDDPDLLNWPAPLKLCATALKQIQDFEPNLTVIKILCNSALRQRHWNQMSQIAKINITPNAGTTLNKMLSLDLKSNLQQYEMISEAASKEQELWNDLQKMRKEWDSIDFQIEKSLLIKLEDVENVLEDQFFEITARSNSIHIAPHKKEAEEFHKALLKIQEVIHEFRELQPRIMEFSPIFECEQMSLRLPEEHEMFEKVLDIHNSIKSAFSNEKNVFLVVNTTDLLQDLQKCLQTIQEIHRGFCDFMSTIRQDFATLYFLTNKDILRLLASGSVPEKINDHVTIIFPFVQELIFKDNQIEAIKGDFTEIMHLKKPVNVLEPLEKWLKVLEGEIRANVHSEIMSSLGNYDENNVENWAKSNISQARIVVANVIFTGYTHKALESGSLQQFLEKTLSMFKVVSKQNSQNKSLLIVLTHHRDILTNLIAAKVSSNKDFQWLVQLRYYMLDGKCTVAFLHNSVEYKCEYFGPGEQIVFTPDTERCFHSLFLAYQNNLNACLEAPSGFGKSEIIKGLAKAVGNRLVILDFNEGLQLELPLTFLKGIVSTGFWLCIENCQKFDTEFAAVFSEELCKITMRLWKDFPNSIASRSTYFVCLNMQGSHYKLPQSLKILFRPVSASNPDIEMIARILLLVAGFENHKKLASQIVKVYNLINDILPDKKCFFGIISINEVLTRCTSGKLYENEEEMVCNALQNEIVPKLDTSEMNVVKEIFLQVFPTFALEPSVLKSEDYVTSYKKLNLHATESHLLKLSQFEEMLQFQKGIILLGETCTGKTTLVNLAKKDVEITKIKQNYMDSVLFWGEMTEESTDWCDGVFPKCLRKNHQQWIVFDGTAKTDFTDYLLSAFDYDPKITLASGEKITINPKASFIFELQSLDCESPAFVSRCGIIYLEPDALGWESILLAWLETITTEWNKDHKENIRIIFQWTIPVCLDYITENCCHMYPMGKMHLFKTTLHFFEILMDEAFESSTKKEDEMKNLPAWIQATIILSVFWGLGCFLDSGSRIKFDEFFKQLWKGQCENAPIPLEKLEVNPPPEGIISDYIYIHKMKGTWKLLGDALKNEKIEESIYLNDIMIPTSDTLKVSFLLNLHVSHKHPILLMGPQQIGKSLLINDFLVKNRNLFESSSITFRESLSSNSLQQFLLTNLHKSASDSHYRPVNRENCILFIDDLNLGSACSLELIRGLMDDSFCYHFDTRKQIFIENVLFVAAVTVDSSLRLDQSLLRHFNGFILEQPQTENIFRIYSNLLMTFFKKNGFGSDFQIIANQIVAATLDIFEKMSLILRPTPTNFFYKFYMNTITTLMQACSMIKKEAADGNKKLIVKLWTHEVYRVFGDRISDGNTSELCENILRNIEEQFAESPDTLFEQLPRDKDGKLSSFNDLLFGSFVENCNRFDEVSMENLREIVTEGLRNFNSNAKDPIDFITFNYALEHLSRICRILMLPNNNNLLQIGISGSGRRTCTKIASILCGQQFFNLNLVQNYNQEHLHKDIKRFLEEAGSLGRPCVCFIKDDQIVNEEMFQDLYFLLKTAEFPGLYSQDEYNKLLNLVRNSLDEKVDPSAESIFLYYKKRCKQNLHIVVSVNIYNESVQKYLRKYNSVFKYCQVDYWQHWPHSALETVATVFLAPISTCNHAKISAACSYLYYSAVALTDLPLATCSYLGFIDLLVDLLKKELVYVEETKQKYSRALDKLHYATAQIAAMETSLANYQPQLEAMTLRSTEMAAQIAKESIEVEKATGLVRRDEEIANQQAAAAAALKLDCETDLAQAIPILEDAISALNTLKPTDITLVKSMKNPPDAIKLVMAAVCVIKEVKPDRIPDPSTGRKIVDYWGPSKRILGDMNFLQTLKDFDKDNIKPEVMVKIRKDYLPHKDFKPHVVAKASSAAEGLCKWIIAMDMYDKVAKEVAPKKEKLEKAEAEYAATVAVLNEKKEQVARIEQRLADLNLMLTAAKREQLQLQKNVDMCTVKLNKALKLISGLIEEKEAWEMVVSQLDSDFPCIPGNMLLVSAIATYLPLCDKEKRDFITSQWSCYLNSEGVAHTESFSLCKLFAEKFDFHHWFINGLPKDQQFLENAIISKLSKRFLVFLDPQLQAVEFLKQLEKYNNLQTTSFFSSSLQEKIAECVLSGKPILIENVQENIGFALRNILFHAKPPNLTLYLATQSRNCKFHSDIYNKITVINFVLNREAIENHLVFATSITEKPSLKKVKKDFDREKSICTNLLNTIETKMLETLSESQSDILEDESALKLLEDLKTSLKQAQKRADENLKLQETLNDFGSIYKAFSRQITIFYLTMYDLIKINHMYHFSFKWFLEMFHESIQKTRKSKEIETRVQHLITTVILELYKKVSRSLFEPDKLLFVFLISLNLLISKGEITQEQVDFFGKTFSEEDETIPTGPEWLSRKSWIRIFNTSKLEKLKNFPNYFIQYIESFKRIFQSTRPNKEAFPKEFSSNFDQLFIVYLLRPDWFYKQINHFVEVELGPEFTKFTHYTLSDSYLESNIQSPLLFLLKTESDPLNPLLNFTKIKKMHNRLQMVSITEGIAEIQSVLAKGRKEGHWICIQNTHLILSVLNHLDLYLNEIDYENTHEDFRLWLTTNENSQFPVSLLEKCIKITQESPKTIKNNMLTLYKEEPINEPDFFLKCPGKTELFYGLTYNLAFVHCLLQQRRLYSHFGWKLPYQFKTDDFLFSIEVLKSVLNQSETPFDEFSFLIGKCVYMNIIRDSADRQTLLSIFEQALCIGSNFKMHPKYQPPIKLDYKDFLKRIDNFPELDEPSVFYLPKNYSELSDLSSSEILLNSLQMLSAVKKVCKTFNKDDVFTYF